MLRLLKHEVFNYFANINDPDLFDSLLSCAKWFKNKEMLDMFNPTSLN